eukprot:CAMPEP_0204426436 /NCGR_PEP_ID=MMETSP0470-20130426/52209_1 /ASSEMBLY_ACC=CAM_ASM_000385 /TAXON_ID=2969 /ORGANISM="Oxyrrhis marina" /LENGTH=57 /DNA_ID=CAMNT_0051424141 /DNA_START=135 /DNA_END=308 /DNA_ORIENTATION=+
MAWHSAAWHGSPQGTLGPKKRTTMLLQGFPSAHRENLHPQTADTTAQDSDELAALSG